MDRFIGALVIALLFSAPCFAQQPNQQATPLLELIKANMPAIVIGNILVILVGAILFMAFKGRRNKNAEGASSEGASSSYNVEMLAYLLVPLILIICIGIILQASIFERMVEIQVGFLVVIAIIALIQLL